MSNLQLSSLILLNLFIITSAINGLYFHLWKYKLYSHPESIYEHRLHTIRAFLFIPIVFLLYFADFGGILLWLAIAFILIDLAIEMLDAFSEKASRDAFGGLSSVEYAIHLLATSFRVSAIALILAAKPIEAWVINSEIVISEGSQTLTISAVNILIGNLLVGILHLVLMNRQIQTIRLPRCRS